MPGLVPGIHVFFLPVGKADVDDIAGPDGYINPARLVRAFGVRMGLTT